MVGTVFKNVPKPAMTTFAISPLYLSLCYDSMWRDEVEDIVEEVAMVTWRSDERWAQCESEAGRVWRHTSPLPDTDPAGNC